MKHPWMIHRVGWKFLAAWALTLTLGPAPAQVLGNEQAEKLVKILADAQPRGGNSELMNQTWKALVAMGPDAVLPILKGMRSDKPLALNFLRPALDAILEKNQGKPEIPQVLEAFVKNTSEPGVARRQAFEWLVRLAPAKKADLAPMFLTDQFPELRREGVALRMDQLKTISGPEAKKEKAEGAKKLLEVACDQDQVTELGKWMKEGGLEFDEVKHYGFLKDWLLLGIFDNSKEEGFEQNYPVEPLPDTSKAYVGKDGKPVKWYPAKASDAKGLVDLNQVIGKEKSAVAYAWTKVESETEQEAEIRLGCWTSLKVWINGEVVFQRDEYHHGFNPDQHIARCKLRKGVNDVVVKICQNNQKESWAQSWQFQARFTDFAGYRLPVKQAELPKIPQSTASAREIKQ